MTARNATVAVIGAGDFIGTAIARKFAAEGFTVFAGRRNGDKLAPLIADIQKAGGRVFGRSLDARKEEDITAFLQEAEREAPLEVCIFNIGANVNFPILDTTERVFRKVWEMACYSGFLAGREAARLMLPHGRGCIFFTGATASMRGGTGYAAFAAAKRLSILKEVVPSLSRVLVLTFLADPIALLQIKAMREAASSLNVALQIQDIRTADDLPAAFEAGARDRVDGLLITAESMFTVNRARVSELAARYRLPAIYPFSISVIEGEGLMSYDADVRELHRRAAVYVDRILKGARAGDLPIQQPAKFKLVVNVKTAKALGLTIPPSILSRADQVIE